MTDKQWLQENILCLLSNAVKYSAKGTVVVSFKLLTNLQKKHTPRQFGSATDKSTRDRVRRIRELNRQRKKALLGTAGSKASDGGDSPPQGQQVLSNDNSYEELVDNDDTHVPPLEQSRSLIMQLPSGEDRFDVENQFPLTCESVSQKPPVSSSSTSSSQSNYGFLTSPFQGRQHADKVYVEQEAVATMVVETQTGDSGEISGELVHNHCTIDCSVNLLCLISLRHAAVRSL
jgi:hypothetical protein